MPLSTIPRCECRDLPQENVTSNTKNPPFPERPLLPPLLAPATWSSNNATRAQENAATDLPLGTRQKHNATNSSRSNAGLTECFYNRTPNNGLVPCSVIKVLTDLPPAQVTQLDKFLDGGMRLTTSRATAKVRHLVTGHM